MSNRLRVFALLVGLLLLALPLELEARERFFGYCITDNVTITKNQRIHNKSCTIRVFDAGTSDLSTIFADNLGTSKSNPFTAASTGFWFFYADDGRYDVQLSLGDPAIGSAFSWGDVLLADGVKGTIETVTFSATPTFDASESDIFSMTLTGNVTSSTITNAVAGKLITLLLIQDGTGGRTFAFPADVVLRTGALAISAGANDVTIIIFVYDGANWQEAGYSPDQFGKDILIDTALSIIGGDVTFDNDDDSAGTTTLNCGATAAQDCSIVFKANDVTFYTLTIKSSGNLQLIDQNGIVRLFLLNAGGQNQYRGGIVTADHVFQTSAGTTAITLDVGIDGMVLGSALDTNLRRSGANTLKTDDGFVMANVATLAASTTPSIQGGNVFNTNNTASITDFLNEENGQVIYLLCGADTTTSLVDSTPLFLAGAFTCTVDDSITLVSNGTIWTEISRSLN